MNIAVPTTTADKKDFSIEAFLSAVSKLDVSIFKKYGVSAAILRYCAGLLVSPNMILKHLNHWEVSKPNKSQPINKPSNQTGIKPNHRMRLVREKNRPDRPRHAGANFFLL